MAPAQLAPGFSLREGKPEELPTLLKIMLLAVDGDPMWHHGVKDCQFDALHKWIIEAMGWRWLVPDVTTYVIVEDATGEIVAWTGLQYPWNLRPVGDEMKAKITTPSVPTLAEDMFSPPILECFSTFGITKKNGWDIEKDYHRKSTMVRPGYQKKGFGTVLTQHCNAISDKTGGRTFVTARPPSTKMFLNNGYKVLQYHSSQLERWGLDPAWNKTAGMMREPSS